MAVLDITRSHIAPSSVFGQSFARLIAAFVSWNDARVTRNTLNSLSDRELTDIGLVRCEIEQIARNR